MPPTATRFFTAGFVCPETTIPTCNTVPIRVAVVSARRLSMVVGERGEPALLHDLLHRRIGDAELLEIRAVLLRVVLVLPHLGAVLLHDVRVQPDGRLVGRREEGVILGRLRLD